MSTFTDTKSVFAKALKTTLLPWMQDVAAYYLADEKESKDNSEFIEEVVAYAEALISAYVERHPDTAVTDWQNLALAGILSTFAAMDFNIDFSDLVEQCSEACDLNRVAALKKELDTLKQLLTPAGTQPETKDEKTIELDDKAAAGEEKMIGFRASQQNVAASKGFISVVHNDCYLRVWPESLEQGVDVSDVDKISRIYRTYVIRTNPPTTQGAVHDAAGGVCLAVLVATGKVPEEEIDDVMMFLISALPLSSLEGIQDVYESVRSNKALIAKAQ